MLVGLLGILKAGGAYLPLDPSYPRTAWPSCWRMPAAPVLVTQSGLLERCGEHGGAIVQLDADWPAIAQKPTTAPPNGLQPHNTAYVIYTSGSTGTPKGVAVSHIGLPNLAAVKINHLKIAPEARVLQLASLSFDAAVWEIVATLIGGASLNLLGSTSSAVVTN